LKKIPLTMPSTGLILGGVVEDDVGALAAELEGDLAPVPASSRWIRRPTASSR
jgi:hypothetical protein